MAESFCQTIASRGAARRLRGFAFTFGFALLLSGQPAALPAYEPPTEYQVKAAFLLNFTKFIEWPAPDSNGVDSAFNICIQGESPVGPALAQMVEGETVNGRRLAVLRGRLESSKGCRILYSDKGEKELPDVLANAGLGVLTVGEGDSFLRAGGMIAFVIENRRVRFSINLLAARNASLRFSSKLLSVAKAVEK